MNEPFPHHHSIVEKFWAENQELKFRLFRAWYLGDDIYPIDNKTGQEAVTQYVGKGAVMAARSSMKKYEDGTL